MGAVTEGTCLLFYTAGLFDWSFCELICSVNENTAWTNRHWAIIQIWNDLNACSVISVCHSWVSRRWIWRTDLSSGLWRRVVLSYLPPFPFPCPYMCINSASQSYRIASSTAVTSLCYTEFFLHVYVLPLVLFYSTRLHKNFNVKQWRHCSAARYAITLTRAIYTHVWTRKVEGGEIRKSNTSS